MTIGLRQSWSELEPAELARWSRAALDVPLADDAELWIAQPKGDAVLAGAFQRATDARRGSGGPSVRVGSGSLWVALVLRRPNALVECDEPRLLNRHVRPILRALTKSGALAHYFGRDWIAVKHRPAAWIGFAHDAASGRTLVEAVIARDTPFDAGPRGAYAGKAPATLAELTGKVVDARALADAIAAAWSDASGHAIVDRGALGAPASEQEAPSLEPPWAAEEEEAIGPIGAGPDARGVLRVGGDWMVSRDAVTALERALVDASDVDVPAVVDRTLAAPGVAIEGVRALESVARVIARARRET